MDVESVQWLLTDDGQRVLGQACALDEPDPLRARSALATRLPRYAVRAAGRGADPGRAAHPGRREVRRPGRVDVLHAGRARAGDPALGGHPPGGSAQGVRRLDGGGPRLRHRRRPGGLRAGRHHRGRCGPRPGAGRRRDREPVRPGAARRGRGRRCARGRHHSVRRGLRRPGPSYRPGPGVLAGRLDPAVVLRRVAAGRRGLRQDRAGHPARRGPRRRRGRVGERPRRGEGGRALGRPARHGRPPRDRDPGRRPGHASPTRTTPVRTSSRSAGSSTSPTAR